MTETEGAPTGRPSFAKIITLLNLAVLRAEQAAVMAESLGQRARARAIRKAAKELSEEIADKPKKMKRKVTQ